MNKFLKKAEGFVASRGFSAGVVTALVVALVIVANVIIYTFSSLFNLSLVSPIKLDYTYISDETKELLSPAEEKGEKVTITFCMAKEELEQHDTGKFVLATANAFDEMFSFIELRFVNLLTQVTQNEDGSIVVNDLSKYKTDMRGEPTELRTHSVIFEHEGGNYRVLTDVYSSSGFADFFTLDSTGATYAYSGEEVIAAMVSWVLHRNDERKTVYFTENHGEKVDVTFGNLLTAAGYYIDTVNLRTDAKKITAPDSDAAFVVISNPISDFGRAAEGSDIFSELEQLELYLKEGNGGKGGKLYVSIDPYADRLENLEGLLSEFGVELAGRNGKYGYARELVVDPAESRATDGMSFNAYYGSGEVSQSIVDNFESSGNLLMTQVSRLNIDGSKGAEALLVSSPTSRVICDRDTVDSEGGYAVAAYSSRSEAGGATSEIFVVPSILMTNSDVLISDGYSNRDYVYALLEEIFDADTALYGTKSIIYDSGAVENLTQRTATVFTVILIAIPVAIAVLGAVVVVRRKRR